MEPQKDYKEQHSMNILELFMEKALKQAEKAYSVGEVSVGCVFVEFVEGREAIVWAESHNLTNASGNATDHCEIICINKILEQAKSKSDDSGLFSRLTLFVTCEPCIMCAYALNLMNIKEVYFGCKNERFGGNGSIFDLHKRFPHSYKSTGGIKEQECRELLQKFYERGNFNIPEEHRHRKKVKVD